MGTKEIITLQFGNYANFIGTHWWNIQESSFQYNESDVVYEKEVDHDVLFREGETSRGQITFTPRLVLTELKGGLGGLRSSGFLYDDDEEESETQIMHTWDGDVDFHKQTPESKNKFLLDLNEDQYNEATEETTSSNGDLKKAVKSYDLETDVKVWSDYLKTYLHPKSINIINEYSHRYENDPFDLWTKGADLKNTLEVIEERIRFYAEECDRMQGFHIIADSYDGFAGLTSSTLQYLHDEFSSKRLATFPVIPAMFHKDSKVKSLKRDLNQALSLPLLMEHSSLVCPLSLGKGSYPTRTNVELPYLLYDVNLNYHTSAVLAASLDTATFNHRLKGNSGVNMNQFCDNVTFASRNLMSMSLTMPFPCLKSSRTWLDREYSTLSDFLNGHLKNDPWSSISQGFENAPFSHQVVEVYSQSLTLRGLSHHDDSSSFNSNSNPFSQCKTQHDMLRLYLAKRFHGCHNFVSSLPNPMKTSAPFPQFFDKQVNHDGLITNANSASGARPWQLNGFDYSAGLDSDQSQSLQSRNGHLNGCSNGHFQSHVESIPILTNIECSSKSAQMLKTAAICLRQCKTRHFSFHRLENENIETEIENLYSLQDEYKTHQDALDQSDSDSDL